MNAEKKVIWDRFCVIYGVCDKYLVSSEVTPEVKPRQLHRTAWLTEQDEESSRGKKRKMRE